MKAEKPTSVSLVQLIADPNKFDRQLIRVIGFLRLEFEGNALYLHREDYQSCLMLNGIWVDVNPDMDVQRGILDMNYVLLEGIFSARDRGHQAMWSGTIGQIQRAQLWPTLQCKT